MCVIDVVDDGVLRCRSAGRRGRAPGRAAIRARRAARPASPWVAKFSQRARMRSETAVPVFSPPSLNVGSLGPVTRLPQTKGNSVAWAAAMRSSRSIGVAKSKRYRYTGATCAVSFGQPHRGHPEADVARYTHAAGLAAQAARRRCRSVSSVGQLQGRLFGGDLGEHRVDRLRRDRHQRRLHPLEQRRLVLVGADDQRDRMRAAVAGQLTG